MKRSIQWPLQGPSMPLGAARGLAHCVRWSRTDGLQGAWRGGQVSECRGCGLTAQRRRFWEEGAAVTPSGGQVRMESPAWSPGETTRRGEESDGPPGLSQLSQAQARVWGSPGDAEPFRNFPGLQPSHL